MKKWEFRVSEMIRTTGRVKDHIKNSYIVLSLFWQYSIDSLLVYSFAGAPSSKQELSFHLRRMYLQSCKSFQEHEALFRGTDNLRIGSASFDDTSLIDFDFCLCKGVSWIGGNSFQIDGPLDESSTGEPGSASGSSLLLWSVCGAPNFCPLKQSRPVEILIERDIFLKFTFPRLSELSDLDKKRLSSLPPLFKIELTLEPLRLTALDLNFFLRVPLMFVTGGECSPSWPWVFSSDFEESIDNCKLSTSLLLFRRSRFSCARKRSSDLCCFSNFSCSHLFLTAKAFLNSLEKFLCRSSFFRCIMQVVLKYLVSLRIDAGLIRFSNCFFPKGVFSLVPCNCWCATKLRLSLSKMINN